jgi:hypothetical protein
VLGTAVGSELVVIVWSQQRAERDAKVRLLLTEALGLFTNPDEGS